MEYEIPRQIFLNHFTMRAICHNICHTFVYNPEYTWSSIVKILWNRLDTTEHISRWYVITLGTPDTHGPSYAIVMAADALVWNRHHAISNHHDQLIMVILHVSGIMSHPLNNARERSRGRPPASFFDKFREAFKLDANWSSPRETDKQYEMNL